MQKTRQTNKRVAALLIQDALSTALDGYWTEQFHDFEHGAPDPEWVEDVLDQMQRICNPVFDRLERILKGFSFADVEPKRKA